MPFHFEVASLIHSDFSNFLNDSWKYEGNWNETVDTFTKEAKDWNINIFRHVGKRKHIFMAWLNGIEKGSPKFR